MRPKLSDYLEASYPVELRGISSEDGGGFVACIPVLGRHSYRAFGDTPEEALAELEQVRRALLEDRYERGEVIPLPPDEVEERPSGMPGLRLSPSLHALAQEKAAEEGISVNRYLEELIAYGIGRQSALKLLEQKVEELTQSVARLSNQMSSYEFDVSQSPREQKLEEHARKQKRRDKGHAAA